MAYSIYQDMEEVNQNPDKWINHGRQVLESSCHHKDGVEYAGYCSKCDISEDSAIPMMNYLYPLECSNFEDKDILKVVKETNMTILENTETGEFFFGSLWWRNGFIARYRFGLSDFRNLDTSRFIA